jgi:hypothetical protein
VLFRKQSTHPIEIAPWKKAATIARHIPHPLLPVMGKEAPTMSAPKDRTYPAAAKKATWNKAQTAGDKLDPKTKNTGLGKALESAEFWWTRIPFDAFDPKKAKISNYSEAGKAKAAADKALTDEVASAKRQVAAALKKAGEVKNNKALSPGAKKAATDAEAALKLLNARFFKFDTKDFDPIVAQHKLAYDQAQKKDRNLADITVYFNRDQVATGRSGTWNREVFKSKAMAWSGVTSTYVGKTVKVFAKYADDGSSFQADLKVKTAANGGTELEGG